MDPRPPGERCIIATDTGPRLHFSDDSAPGIARKRMQRGETAFWAYYDSSGRRITDRAEIDRLDRIALPPAYEQAWFCPRGDGHLLATGIDARGRKQYRYHPLFRLSRESAKFDQTARFGQLLPRLRARVERDLAERALCRTRAIASVVRLLDTGGIRVGNEAYARANRSFGATTLRMRHARVKGRALKLRFTAKHFRTWHASVLAFDLLAQGSGKIGIKTLATEVSERLGNTPAIARKSYIHPAVLALVDRQEEWRRGLRLPRATRWLSRAELGLIALLEEAPVAAELLAG